MNKKIFKAIDFFCGGGGMTYGLRQAGIDVVAGVDIDKEAKEKCKPATAYQKKNGTFLAVPFAKPEQQAELTDIPVFYREYKILPGYTEYNPKMVCNPSFVTACFETFLKK